MRKLRISMLHINAVRKCGESGFWKPEVREYVCELHVPTGVYGVLPWQCAENLTYADIRMGNEGRESVKMTE